MNGQRSRDEPHLTENDPEQPPTTALEEAVRAGFPTLLITELDGTVRRIACPGSRDVLRVHQELFERNILTAVAPREHQFMRSLFEKAGRSGPFSAGAFEIYLNGTSSDPVYLHVSRLATSRQEIALIAWRFSNDQQTLMNTSDHERALTRHISVLNTRVDTYRSASDHARRSLRAVMEVNRSLSSALQSSRDLRTRQSEILTEANRDKDELLERLRRSWEAAVDARKGSERSRHRLEVLAEASRVLGQSLDVDTTLESVAELPVPGIADCCVVTVIDEEHDVLNHAAVACKDQTIADTLRQTMSDHLGVADTDSPVRAAVSSGHTVVVHDFNTDRPDVSPFVGWLKGAGVVSCMATPLRARDHVFGTLTLALADNHRLFEPDDLLMAEELAQRGAQALDTALLFRQAQEASKVRERYLAMASHELRSPLTVVSGFGRLLIRNLSQPEPDLEKTMAIGHELQVGLDRLELLTEGLLAVSSMHEKPDLQELAGVDLVRLVNGIVRQAQSVVEDTVDRVIHLESPPALVGRWNGENLERAVSNLLSNALKYSPADRPVSITVRKEAGDAVVTVQDDGIGMTSDELEDLFTPFMRGHRARKAAMGTGLGLYITKQIVDQHHGEIDVQSEPGAGTTMRMRLPLRPPRASVDGHAGNEPHSPA